MFLSLPTLTILIPLISLAGLFCSSSVEENSPQGCTSTASQSGLLHLLLPITIPVNVFSHLRMWLGIKLFRHN
ncbi:phosphatidylinositol N-acetylglucosaminyltransferase subunit Y-like [Myotis lucifugus]|uniref:phosphatidylinositol N-acetylglucosaminyltransferase subunit Y-like n=1 Tax=Myotis lucifugus TaxID=59463 RepID=UPI0003C446BB|nr:phosphatidylinositol N-acetylglucosaminyltransferase subunit Y-like [Myotis lucifugus]